jgi:hypothetical protein
METTVPDQITIEPIGRELFWLPGAGTVLPTTVPDIELVGRSLATRLVHSCGTVVETVKALVFEEMVYAFCQGLFALQEGFKYPAFCKDWILIGQALLVA